MSHDSLARATGVLAGIATASAAISLLNLWRMPQLRSTDAVTESVVVCIPARNEASRIALIVTDLLAQRSCPQLRVLVLDDNSSDDTAAAARDAAGDDRRVRVHTSVAEPPRGWTGKAAACAELARLAFEDTTPLVIIFVDADVRLQPDAIAGAVTMLRRSGVALVCPWPEQRVGSLPERLVQPLLAWSWMSTLPVAVANRTTVSSMAVACGQFMAFDFWAYRDIGGHHSVAASVTEDLDLARALRKRGYRTALVSGAGVLSCRMYGSSAELRSGYSRWLWNEFGGPGGSVAAAIALSAVYIFPPVVALTSSGTTRRLGLAGYVAGAVSRVAARRREVGARFTTGDVLDSALHPVSIAAFVGLVAESHLRRHRGSLAWKDRPMPMQFPRA